MKNFIINKCMDYINRNGSFSKDELEKIKYGLVSVYITLTKIIIILLISITFKIFKEVALFMLFFNILRTFAFGLHASKSWQCWISSIISFILIPYLCISVSINKQVILVICLINTLLIYKNAPADTAKRPIVNKKRRLIYKTLSTILSIIYSIVAAITSNNFICNCMIFALILENILISPFTYKILNMPYNNYINFLKKHPDFTI